MHFPQSMHRSFRIVALPLRTRMASVGQFLMQVVQPMQRAYSKTTECLIPFTSSGQKFWGPMLIFMVTVVPVPTVESIDISSA